MARLIVIILALAVATAPIGAGARGSNGNQDTPPPEVTVTVDRTQVTVGDPINLNVSVKHASDVTIQTTSLDDQLGALDPLSSDPPEDKASGNAMELRLHYRVAMYRTGSAQVPAFTIRYTAADGTANQVSAKAPIQIEVQSVLAPGATSNDIRGLKPQISLPEPASATFALAAGIAGGVVLAAAAVALLWLLLRGQRRVATAANEPAAVAARVELDRISALGLLESGEFIEHYRLVANCIRQYVAERFGFPATALTTAEIAAEMERRGIERWPARLIAGLLGECDAVVYARYQPAWARAMADSATAFEIVDVTNPPEQQPALQAV